MVKVKVANPGPAALMVVNGRRRKTMKKRRSTRRTARRPVVASNPRPRRRRLSVSLRRRHHNPAFTHHRRRRSVNRRRHRNPPSGLFTKGLTLAAGAALVQFTLTFVPPIGGVTPLADAARTAAVGFGLGTLMDKTGIGRKYG